MSSRRPFLEDNYKFCSSCGHSNPPWRSTCERCKAELEDLPDLPVSGSRERPGCVTAYAALTAIGAILTIVAGVIFSLSGTMMSRYFNEVLSRQGLENELFRRGIDSAFLNQILSIMVPAILIVTFLVGVFNLLIAWGLWRLKNWARILVIVLQGLGLLGNVYSMVTTLITPSTAHSAIPMYTAYGTACATLVSLGIGGYIVFWFAVNGEYFR